MEILEFYTEKVFAIKGGAGVKDKNLIYNFWHKSNKENESYLKKYITDLKIDLTTIVPPFKCEFFFMVLK